MATHSLLCSARQTVHRCQHAVYIPSRMASSLGQATTSSNADPRQELIRKVLFEASIRPKELTLQGEALEQHEAIERAYMLHLRLERERRQQALERQFRAMNQAMSELEKTSDRLFKGASVKSRHITYPKQAKIPTETPSPQGWDYSFKSSSQDKHRS